MLVIGLLALAFLTSPLPTNAQGVEVTLTVSPTTVELGQDIQVGYNVLTSSFRSYDRIIMFRADTNQMVDSERIGTLKTGTKIFSIKKPGSYYFQYKPSLPGNPVFATSGTISVVIPDSSSYTLTPSKTSLGMGETLQVTYAGPAHAHQSGDDIFIVDAVTGKYVTIERLGTSSSGVKSFVMNTPGTYLIQYKLSLADAPVVKTTGPITVLPPDLSNYSIAVSAPTIPSGQPFTITYSGSPLTHKYGDDIILVEVNTNRQIAIQSLGTSPQGTKTFTITNPGTYRADYKLSSTGFPVVASTLPFVVTLPDSSLYSLTTDIQTAEVNQPVTLQFGGPEFAHDFGDDILVYDAVTGALLKTVTVGSSPTGTKTFRFLGTGTFKFAYRMNVAGLPIVKESATVSVVLVNLSRIQNYPLRDGPIIALGDSITFGRDATPGNDHISLLSARIGETIVNAGVSGDTTTDALARLETDVLSKNPRLVLVSLGGNDFLQRVPTDTIFANLEEIVERIQADGAAVLILGYKDFLLFSDYDSRYRAIADRTGSAYTPDIMSGILGRFTYTTDGIHPKDNGHKIIADRVEPYLNAFLTSAFRSLAPAGSSAEVVVE